MIKAACGVGIKEEAFTHQFPFLAVRSLPHGCYCFLHFQDCMCEYQIGCDPHLSIRRKLRAGDNRGAIYRERGALAKGHLREVYLSTRQYRVPQGLNQTRWGLMQVFDMIAIDFDPVLCFLIKTGIKTVDCSCVWLFLTHGSTVMSLKG